MATYGSFPGVKVQTVSGGITGIQLGEEEKLVLFGETGYNDDGADGEPDTLSGAATPEAPETINARREANDLFTDGSELAEAMKEALANGANIDYLYGVAVNRFNVDAEGATDDGVLANFPIYEDRDLITFTDTTDGDLTVEFRYSDKASWGTPDTDNVYINPLTGEYLADAAASGSYEVSYKWLDWESAFTATEVSNVITEGETGIYAALSDADTVSIDLQSQVSTLRNDYQLVNALSIAEPNDQSSETPPDARYDTATYDTANQSVTEEYYYKFAPGREEDKAKTILGGIGGLFAGNAINDPIYNEALNGYQGLEQVLSKSEADNLRGEDIIPVRDSGTIRVKGNRSTAYSEADATGADFWVRRITDRVVLIGKLVGDQIIGRINDQDTRDAAERLIQVQMEGLVQDRLIRPNADGEDPNWSVDVYEDSSNPDEVNIDISFTPYGIVKRVDETITIDTTV